MDSETIATQTNSKSRRCAVNSVGVRVCSIEGVLSEIPFDCNIRQQQPTFFPIYHIQSGTYKKIARGASRSIANKHTESVIRKARPLWFAAEEHSRCICLRPALEIRDYKSGMGQWSKLMVKYESGVVD
jgi:hypothetical protein